jgi:hypothetical protein
MVVTVSYFLKIHGHGSLGPQPTTFGTSGQFLLSTSNKKTKHKRWSALRFYCSCMEEGADIENICSPTLQPHREDPCKKTIRMCHTPKFQILECD